MGRQTTNVGVCAISWWIADMSSAAAGPDTGGIRACATGREFSSIENRDSTQEYVELMKMTVESRNGVKIALLPASSDE